MQEDRPAETEERALSSSPGRGQSRQNCWDGKMWEDQSENSREKTRGWIWAWMRTCKEGKERVEGRWSSGAALKRTKSKGREGAGAECGEKVSVLGCTREHWFDMQLLDGYNEKEGECGGLQTAKVSDCATWMTCHTKAVWFSGCSHKHYTFTGCLKWN